MNVVIQALTHTPLLRDYFLLDKHERCINDQDKCIGQGLKDPIDGGPVSPEN